MKRDAVDLMLDDYAARRAQLFEAATFIESIPADEFNMHHWWLTDGMAFDDDRNRVYRVADGQCGCAVGHMIQKGLFGLTDEHTKYRGAGRQAAFVKIGDVFGVNYKLAEFMFDAYSYAGEITRERVAARCRFVASEDASGIWRGD